ncbi:LacI family transcriptional regulator [Geodermatophilaceae bacterium NBWT11]|nr:LacI family transcriptional regulator [Geodermatophilaceae bacterium NBWT11]
MGRSNVTIYDVASTAGVSISTVSNALNRPDRVREDTRRRVLEAAESLGFTPKSEAVNQARRGVGRIGVIAPFVAYQSYMRRLSGVLEVMNKANLEVCLYDEESAASRTSLLLSRLPLGSRLDGLIVMGIPLDDEAAERLLAASFPTVLVDSEDPGFSCINSDNALSGRLLARHLLAAGHTQIGYVNEEHQFAARPQQGVQRFQAFAAELATAGHPLPPHRVVETRHSPDDARVAATRLLTDRDVTAVAAHDDVLAVGVLHAAAAHGLRVPADLAVTGCDDGDVAAAVGLTTVAQPFEDSGRLAATTLLELMHGDHPIRKTVLGQELVVRSSTDDTKQTTGPPEAS